MGRQMTAATTSPESRRRLAGYRARGAGAGFEGWLSAYVFRPLVERQVILRFDKTDPPMRQIRDAARGVLFVPVGAGGADWILLGQNGLYIAIESKSTDDIRLYRDEILPHQVAHLDAAVKAGGGAFLAVQFRGSPTATAYLVPWQSASWSCARTAPSIEPTELQEWMMNGWIDAARILRAKRV